VNLFYEPKINGPSVTLNKDDSGHLARVLRANTGDTIHLTDGKGFFYECVVVNPNPKKCLVKIIKKEAGKEERSFRLHIAIAPTKNISRFEWFLEKSTEIGINEITPLLSGHSERKVIKTDRLNRVLIAAMKQSLKSHLPELKEITKFKDLINKPFNGQKFIAYVDNGLEDELFHICQKDTDTLILIGPEGDFSREEISEAADHGFKPVKLGPSRLRTETAGVVACHTVNLVNL
jgi:16S rRNA (uracil1498-N3)-methyltransferase